MRAEDPTSSDILGVTIDRIETSSFGPNAIKEFNY